MTDAPPEAGARPLDAKQIAELARQLTELLRLRTLPFGMKLFESAEEMAKIPGLRRPPQGRTFSTCQLVTQARIAGFTMGITHENVPGFSNCGGVIGLNEPSELYLSGRKFEGVWFENREAARKHQAEMPRVPPRYAGLCVSPLRSARLDPPDICLFYANPAQMILFINGLQWKTYRRFDFSITGESACADSWGKALRDRAPSLSIPCYAERRYGGVADDEMLMALPPADLAVAVEGLIGLSKAGLRYPIMPYGPQADPAEGMAKSYAGKT
ncbi:DUF169 domain-containing protein [Roseomonas alkaliterrae]|uniref:Uncharacterized protein (DUF169 family) n=1 Tax=Neoroseomonas alkaliterrae TaxID=1452450 RepID=A0A840XZZ9_9PROT|nr:DUF169 domain-containing protein [Neoroseomonas alkaliterrae]MBB5689747.1 uncharacterized protein (DUF169 family) [Neoroseomonas alkaliterrae]MBR0674891.1 DUF169 domain-containing protein [Neoroseomonas alkaliterrae]